MLCVSSQVRDGEAPTPRYAPWDEEAWLALESECRRLLRRITVLAVDGASEHGAEMTCLLRRLGEAQSEIAALYFPLI